MANELVDVPSSANADGAAAIVRLPLLCTALLLGACSTGADLVEAEQAEAQEEARQATLDALEAAATEGDLASQMRLASMYYDGRTVPRDRGKAAVWYRAAADQGLAEAYYSLGIMLEDGHGLPNDAAADVAAYRVAAEAGVPAAMRPITGRSTAEAAATGRASRGGSTRHKASAMSAGAWPRPALQASSPSNRRSRDLICLTGVSFFWVNPGGPP